MKDFYLAWTIPLRVGKTQQFMAKVCFSNKTYLTFSNLHWNVQVIL